MVKVGGSSSAKGGESAGSSSSELPATSSGSATVGRVHVSPSEMVEAKKTIIKLSLTGRKKIERVEGGGKKRSGNSNAYLEGMFRFLETSAHQIKRYSKGTIGRTPAAPLVAIDSFRELLPKVNKKLSKQERIKLAKIEWKKLRDAEEEHEKNYRRKKTRQ
jgi:hypothetical protein